MTKRQKTFNTPEWKERNRLARLGKPHSPETIEKIRQFNLGRKHTLESRMKMSKAVSGEKHYNWKGGNRRTEDKIIRQSIKYRIAREACFKRDNYTCQGCGERGVKLNADHIKRFADFPELRFDINNLRTLCESCHRKTPTYGNRFQEPMQLQTTV